MAFVAFLDACVLFPTNLRDIILTIAEAGICQIRWSPDVVNYLALKGEACGEELQELV